MCYVKTMCCRNKNYKRTFRNGIFSVMKFIITLYFWYLCNIMSLNSQLKTFQEHSTSLGGMKHTILVTHKISYVSLFPGSRQAASCVRTPAHLHGSTGLLAVRPAWSPSPDLVHWLPAAFEQIFPSPWGPRWPPYYIQQALTPLVVPVFLDLSSLFLLFVAFISI